tara:strand:- start:179 stop:415 length:237 start_codon:yes stop_codon:yes gene_type:complete
MLGRKKILTDQGVYVDPTLTFNVKQGQEKLSLALSVDYARNGFNKTAAFRGAIKELSRVEHDLDFDYVALRIGKAILD